MLESRSLFLYNFDRKPIQFFSCPRTFCLLDIEPDHRKE